MGSLNPGRNHELQRLNLDNSYRNSPAPEISRSSSPASAWFPRSHAQDEPSSFRGSTNTLNPATKSHFIEDTTQLQPTDTRAPRTTSWGIYWRSPALMTFFLVAGIAFALGHHFHYQSLDGTEVSSETKQQWAIRIGTGFAFLCKASLVGSVGVAYTQRLWVTVKKRYLSLQNLDDAFSLTTDPFSFFSGVLISAKLLCLLAACMWCIPIVATITPATLTVRSGLSNDTSRASVPQPAYGNELTGITWVNFEGVGRVESTSAAVDRLIAATSSSISVLPFTPPHPNASYTLDFYAPAIKCETLSAAAANNTIKLDDAAKLRKAWNETMSKGALNPMFEQLYIGKTMSVLDDYYIANHYFIQTGGPSGSNYSCHAWNASYTVDFLSVDGTLSSTITHLEHVTPLSIPGGDVANEYAPGQIAYWALISALSDVIVTEVYFGSTNSLMGADTDIFKSGIPACPEIRNNKGGGTNGFGDILSPWMCRNGSVPRAVEDLSRNVSLSLMSSALFSNKTDVDVAVTSPQNYYSYNWRNLLYAYLAAAVVALACVAVGAHAYVVNGYSASSSFSSIMFTTRNADLDKLSVGQCLGKQPMPKDVKSTMLRYGVLRSSEGQTPHATFGFRDTVVPLKKGDPCS